MEAGALGGELDEHRDGAVGLRARLCEEAVRDLALHHHAPVLDLVEHEALGHDRRGDVVRQVGDELVRPRFERRDVEVKRVAPSGRRRAGCPPGATSSRRSISTAWTCATRAARNRVRIPSPGPISSTTSSGAELREALDHAQDVLVHQEVLAERLARDDGHRPKTAAAFASIWAASSSTPTPRASASAVPRCAARRPARSGGRERPGARDTGCRSRRAAARRERAEPPRAARTRSCRSRCRRTRRTSRARARARAAPATRSSGGSPGRRARRAVRACRRRRRECGSRPASPRRGRRRADARRGVAARRAVRSRGSSRAPSRRRRRPSGARAAPGARERGPPPGRRPRAGGFRATRRHRRTSPRGRARRGRRRASSRPRRSARRPPRARGAITSAASSPRCACVSITRRRASAPALPRPSSRRACGRAASARAAPARAGDRSAPSCRPTSSSRPSAPGGCARPPR